VLKKDNNTCNADTARRVLTLVNGAMCLNESSETRVKNPCDDFRRSLKHYIWQEEAKKKEAKQDDMNECLPFGYRHSCK
jgi:hypothetical protein